MNWIASRFLRAKSWEIFLLFAGMMAVSTTAMAISMQRTSDQEFGKGLALWWGLDFLFMFCFLGWLWAMGSFLNSIVRPGLRPGLGLFRFALIYPMVYIAFFMIVFPPQPAVLALILPLHLVAMFCMFYIFNYVAKNLMLAETGKRVSFSDYAGPFFLIWFFLIGVWFVQPRINLLYAESKRGDGSTDDAATLLRI